MNDARAAQTVAIVGGGPAGLAAAIAARSHGFRALVFDRQTPPIDKACGEGLMPGGVQALNRLGVNFADHEVMRFPGLQLVTNTRRGPLVATAPFQRGEYGLGIRRTVLHRRLIDTALRCGAELHWGVAVQELSGDRLRTSGGELRADWVLGADGLHSRVRRWIDAARLVPGSKRYGLRRHYRVTPWTRHVEVHWGDNVDAYVTPVAPDVVGIALLCAGTPPDYDSLLARFPQLAARLRDCELVSQQRGAGPFRQKPRAVQRGRVALIGDASGYVDPITGEGLTLAFRQAEAALAAIAAGDLSIYAKRHKQIMRMPTMFTLGTLAVHAAPWLQRATVQLFRSAPSLLSLALAHTT